MAETLQASDKGLGLAYTFGALAVVGALAMFATSYLYALSGDAQMQIYSGVAFAVAMAAGGLSVAVFHMYE